MIILRIKQNGTLKEIKNNEVDNLDNIPIIHYWKEDSIQLLGHNIEKGCNENKYDLPPPIDSELYFGDLYIVKVDSNNNIINCTLKDFEKFYNLKFKGFYDINSTDEEEEDELSEHTSDRDFIDDEDIEDNDDDDIEDEEDDKDNENDEDDEDDDSEISFSISDNDDEKDDNDIEIIDDLNESSEKKNELEIEIDVDDLEF